MKKNSLKFSLMALALSSACCLPASAQNWRNAPQYHFGIRAGLSVTNSLDDSWEGASTKDLVGPMFGVAFDTKIAKLPFYVETGAYYMNRGLKYSTDGYGPGHHGNSTTWTENNSSIVIPAMISYHAYVNKEMSFQPFMGPFVSFGLDDSETDYGWRLGCGFNAKQFYVNMGVDLGLKDDFDHHEGNISSFFMTVGWNFLGNR